MPGLGPDDSCHDHGKRGRHQDQHVLVEQDLQKRNHFKLEHDDQKDDGGDGPAAVEAGKAQLGPIPVITPAN